MLEDPLQPVWIDYTSAERYSGLSHTTLWRYVSSGQLKAARVGRSVRIHLPSLKEFMEERTSENELTVDECSHLAHSDCKTLGERQGRAGM